MEGPESPVDFRPISFCNVDTVDETLHAFKLLCFNRHFDTHSGFEA